MNNADIQAFVDHVNAGRHDGISFPVLPYNQDGTPQYPFGSDDDGEDFEDINEDDNGEGSSHDVKLKDKGKGKGKGKGKAKNRTSRRGRPTLHALARPKGPAKIEIDDRWPDDEKAKAKAWNTEVDEGIKHRKLYQNNLSARKTRVRQKIATLKQARVLRMLMKANGQLRAVLESSLPPKEKLLAFEQLAYSPWVMHEYTYSDVSAPETDHGQMLRSYVKDLGMKVGTNDLHELGGDWDWQVSGELHIPAFAKPGRDDPAENPEFARLEGSGRDERVSLAVVLDYILNSMPGRPRPAGLLQNPPMPVADELDFFPKPASRRYTTNDPVVKLEPGEEPLQLPAAPRLDPDLTPSLKYVAIGEYYDAWAQKQPEDRRQEAVRMAQEQVRIAYNKYRSDRGKYELLKTTITENSAIFNAASSPGPSQARAISAPVQAPTAASPPVVAPGRDLAFHPRPGFTAVSSPVSGSGADPSRVFAANLAPTFPASRGPTFVTTSAGRVRVSPVQGAHRMVANVHSLSHLSGELVFPSTSSAPVAGSKRQQLDSGVGDDDASITHPRKRKAVCFGTPSNSTEMQYVTGVPTEAAVARPGYLTPSASSSSAIPTQPTSNAERATWNDSLVGIESLDNLFPADGSHPGTLINDNSVVHMPSINGLSPVLDSASVDIPRADVGTEHENNNEFDFSMFEEPIGKEAFAQWSRELTADTAIDPGLLATEDGNTFAQDGLAIAAQDNIDFNQFVNYNAEDELFVESGLVGCE